MRFTHDTEIALQSAAALVNTMGPPDTLTTGDELEGFVRDQGWSGALTGEPAELEAVRALRPRLARLWELDEDAVVPLVNTLLADARALPQLVDHDDWGWHLHAVSDDAPISTRMAVEAAMAMVDVVRAGELGRLRTCEADGCEAVHVDLSRNRSRRFCSTACGNRMAAAAYRERQATQEDPA
ncbi:CGNR zinc finger domain-containing protein [Ornithinimicrobium sp. W1679]|uniref:CGNR zinc finger domain-containing protein n=1 Tax=unclassified Ornithinimicrobium TaxID=2615080 RepID=UPI003CF7A287